MIKFLCTFALGIYFNLIYLGIFNNNNPWIIGLNNTETQVFCDVQKIEGTNDRYLIASAPISAVPAAGGQDDAPEVIDANRLILCDSVGKIEWQLRGLYFVPMNQARAYPMCDLMCGFESIFLFSHSKCQEKG